MYCKGAVACKNCGTSHEGNLYTKEIKKYINCSNSNEPYVLKMDVNHSATDK